MKQVLKRVSKNTLTKILFGSLLINAGSAWASDSKQPLTKDQVCQRLMITEEVVILDPTGTKIKEVLRETRGARDNSHITLDSSTASKGPCSIGGTSNFGSDALSSNVAFTHRWTVKEDGTLDLTFEQGTDRDRGNDSQPLRGALGKQTVAVKDFAPFVWVSPLHKAERVIIRLTPTLAREDSLQTLEKFPLNLDDATIFDGKGRLWAANVVASGNYIGIITVQGAFMLSFQPFPGAKKIGKAYGHELRFKTEDGTSVVVKTASPFLPGNLGAEVYVLVDQSRKAKSISSQHLITGGKADKTLESFKSKQL